MDTNTNRTPLYNEHINLGARMVAFAGWEMPIQYTGILDEHKCVRENIGLFDVSHMGEVFVYGKDSVNFLQHVVPQNIAKLTTGKAVYCQLTKEDGGIIDDLIIYRLEDKSDLPSFLLIINASRVKEDMEWLEQNNAALALDVVIDNQSANLSLIALQGPKSSELIELIGIKSDEQPEYFSIKQTILESTDVLLSRTGYTGEDGFEILVKNEEAATLWNLLMEKGKELGIKPIGLGARDTLRLEAALHLYGQDMDETTTPVEASLGWSIPKDKKEDYNGKAKILSQFDNKPSKMLVGFKMIDRAIPRHNYEIYINGENAGTVTSGGVSPTLEANIGLGYIDTKYPTKSGAIIEIMIRNKLYKAEISKRPFVPKSHQKAIKK